MSYGGPWTWISSHFFDIIIKHSVHRVLEGGGRLDGPKVIYYGGIV